MSAGNNEKYSRLEAVLQLYGAKDQKWPDKDRGALLDFVKADDAGQQLLREYQALDDCLDFGKVVVAASEGKTLTAHIMSQIAAPVQQIQNEGVQKSDVCSDFNADHKVDKPFTDQLLKMMPFMQKKGPLEGHFTQISLFAASLFLGLFIGLMLTSNPFWEQAIQVAFLDNGIVVEQSFEDVLMGVDVL